MRKKKQRNGNGGNGLKMVEMKLHFSSNFSEILFTSIWQQFAPFHTKNSSSLNSIELGSNRFVALKLVHLSSIGFLSGITPTQKKLCAMWKKKPASRYRLYI